VTALCGAVAVAVWARPGAGGDADELLLQQLISRPSRDIPGVLRDAEGITDPVIRQAAVMEWIRRNQAGMDTVAVVPVCEVLGGIAQDACLRKATSPHLQGIAPQ